MPAASLLQQMVVTSRAMLTAGQYYGSRVLRRPFQPLDTAAARSKVLCGPGSIDAITPFFWESHLPRIRGGNRSSAEEVIANDLQRKKFEFQPVVAHWLTDAVLLDGSVFCRGLRHELRSAYGNGRPSWRTCRPVGHYESGALVSTCAGTTWWGHWLADELPMHLLAQQFAPPVAFPRATYRDEQAYRDLVGATPATVVGTATFDELLIVDEFAQNPLKTERFRRIRQKVQNGPKGHERIFVSRGGTGVRRSLCNEPSVREALAREGFAIVDIATAAAPEVIAACRGAKTVVGVEGSQLAHLLYLIRPGGALVILNPPFQVHTTVADIGVFCGFSSGMFVCQPVAGSKTDFTADPDEVLRFIDDTEHFSRQQEEVIMAFPQRVIATGPGDVI